MTGEKEYQVLCITYTFDLDTRLKRYDREKWCHYRSYKTMKSALNAVKDLRGSNTNTFKTIRTIFVSRFKAQKKLLIK